MNFQNWSTFQHHNKSFHPLFFMHSFNNFFGDFHQENQKETSLFVPLVDILLLELLSAHFHLTSSLLINVSDFELQWCQAVQ